MCQYLDLQSGHRARLLLVTEHYTNSLHARREEMCVDHILDNSSYLNQRSKYFQKDFLVFLSRVSLACFVHLHFFEFRYYLPVACVPSAFALTHINHSLSRPIPRALSVKTDDLLRPFLFQLLQALSFLHGHGVVHRNLDISNVLFDERNQVKLSDYGMFELTGCGNEIGFIVGHALYLPPEVLFAAPTASQVNERGWCLRLVSRRVDHRPLSEHHYDKSASLTK